MTDELARIGFGLGGNAGEFETDGFSEPEDGFTWSVGGGSRTAFTLAKAGAKAKAGAAGLACWLEICLNPFVVPGVLDWQTLTVFVNDVQVGDERLVGEGTVGYRIPPRALRADGAMVVALRHGRAARPDVLGVGADGRCLGFMLRWLRVVAAPAPPLCDATALPPATAVGADARSLLMGFEALGHNCAFGLAQRRAGAEPLGMLRFAGLTLEDLLAGLRVGFAGLGGSVHVREEPMPDGRLEYMVRDDRFGVTLHAQRAVSEATAAEVSAEHVVRLAFARRQFLHFLESGERIFVFQRPGQLTASQMRPLLTLLQGFGPNALLYVDEDGPFAAPMPSGAVARVEAGLFHGRMTTLPVGEAVHRPDVECWASLCANARVLRAGQG